MRGAYPRRRPIGRHDILLEFQVRGNFVKVSAIDQLTGREVATLGPASAGREALGRAAAAKLRYVLRKEKRQAAPHAPRGRGRGILV